MRLFDCNFVDLMIFRFYKATFAHPKKIRRISEVFRIRAYPMTTLVFPVKNGKIEHHHWILHIPICLGTKFQIKLTILIFWTKFVQKGYFRSEAEKSHLCLPPWSLFTILNFSARRPIQTQRDFNVSSPSSRRDNKIKLLKSILTYSREFIYSYSYNI